MRARAGAGAGAPAWTGVRIEGVKLEWRELHVPPEGVTGSLLCPQLLQQLRPGPLSIPKGQGGRGGGRPRNGVESEEGVSTGCWADPGCKDGVVGWDKRSVRDGGQVNDVNVREARPSCKVVFGCV